MMNDECVKHANYSSFIIYHSKDMKDFQDIEKKFFRENRPYWALFDAKGKRKSCTSEQIMKMAGEERVKESFKFLETVLEDEGDGVYKIQMRTSENAGKGQIEDIFQYGDEVEPIQTHRGGDRAERSGGGGKVAGIGALGSIAGIEMIMGLTNAGRTEADRLREEKHTLQMELLESRFKIGNLEAQVAAPAAVDSSWSEFIKGVVQDNSELLLDRILPEGKGERTRIAAVKSKKPIIAPPKRETVVKKATNTEGSPKSNAQARLTAVFENMSQYFPDENPVDVLERLDPIFEDLTALFPDDNPLDVIEVVLELAHSKTGKTMVVPIINQKLAKRAAALEAVNDEDDEDDEDDEEGDGDDE